METARDESCPSGQLRGPIAPGDDIVSSPDEKSFNISKTPTCWRWKRRSPGSIPSLTVWKPQSHWLVAVSWSLCGWRDVPLANVEIATHPGRTPSHPLRRTSSISLRPQQPGGRYGDLPALYRPARHGNPSPTGWLLSHIELACKEGFPSGQLPCPAAPGEDGVSSPDKKSFYVCTIPTPRGR